MKKALIVILFSIIVIAFAKAQESYDRDIVSLAWNNIGTVTNLSFFPNNPELVRLFSKPIDEKRIYYSYHFPKRNWPHNGEDKAFYMGEALAGLGNLLEHSLKSYYVSINTGIYKTSLTSAREVDYIVSRSCDVTLKNVRFIGEVLYSGDNPDGTRVFGGSLILSVDLENIVDAVEQNDAFNDSQPAEDTSIDLQKRLDLLRAIIEKDLKGTT